MSAGPPELPSLPTALSFTRRVSTSPSGDVWSAHGPMGPVAVKVPRTADAQRRLVRAGALLRRVSHPGLVRCLEHCPEGRWLMTPWIDGPTADVWAAGRPAPTVLGAVADVADALAALHHAGGVHGDVKPQNILMGPRGPVLIDPDAAEPGSPGFSGTPGYAAPEQLRGAAATTASDAFALGVTLFQLLTTAHPFSPEPRAQALVPSARLAWTPSMVRGDAPGGLDELSWALLHRDPARRPADLAAAAVALRGLRGRPADPHPPAVFAAWRAVGAWWVQAEGGGVLVLHGPSRAARDAVLAALTAAARADGVAVCDIAAHPALGALVRAPDGAPAAALLRAARGGARVVGSTRRPRLDLADAGATHVSVPALPSNSRDPDAARLVAALTQGPRSVGDLAQALDLGALDLLELAEPLLVTGQLEERGAGALLALPDRG